jgi:hypothetical protein
MKIGHSKIPPVSVPAFLKGQVVLMNLAQLQGQWGIICDLPPFEFGEAVFLNQYHRTVRSQGAVLLGMRPCVDLFGEAQLPKIKVLGMPVLADPLDRLRRLLGVSRHSSSDRCRSYIFDQKGVVRYQLVHRLSWHGMSFLGDVLRDCQDLYSQEAVPCTKPSSSCISPMPRLFPTPSLDLTGGMRYAGE